jgi:two-component system, sensor histidine kinase
VDNCDAVQTFLRLDGPRVEVARDGLTGVEMARAVRPEVAFIDIGLPGLNGYEVGRQIRGSLGISVMLCALTGYGRPEDLRRAREAGFDVHLVKPVTPEALRDILARRAVRPAKA